MRLVGVVKGRHINVSGPYIVEFEVEHMLYDFYLCTGTDTLMCRPFTTPTKRILLVVRFE